jgi:tetratricopeptide (TPR) repeat protein
MGRVLNRELGKPSSVPIIRRIKPHISSLMDTIRQLENDTSAKEAFTVDICHALECIGQFLNPRYSGHDYEDAYYVYRISLDKSTQFLGSENQLVFALMGELSLVLEELERFDEAIPLAEQRVALCSKHIGASHSDTLSALNDLGKALTMQGNNLDAVRKALTTALRERMNLYGRSELTAQTMINLGMLLSNYRELDEAREILEVAASYLEDMDSSENWSLRLDSLGCLGPIADLPL